MFFYARDSLLHYAQWVYTNEVPYKEVLHKVEYPTETWSAQDVRKSCVMNFAAKYAATVELKQNYRNKAKFFYQRCLSDLQTFDTAFLTRPLVLLSVYGTQQGYFESHPEEGVPYYEHTYDFGEPVSFLNQRQRVKATVKKKIKITVREVRRLVFAKFLEKLPVLKR